MEKMPLVQVAQNKKAKICKKTNAEVALLPRFLQIVYNVRLGDKSGAKMALKNFQIFFKKSIDKCRVICYLN